MKWTNLRMSKGILIIALMICSSSMIMAQQTSVSGSVVDAITGEVLPGTTIIVKGKVVGTTSDINGEFFFSITLPPPFTLVFSSLGYEIKEISITEESQEIEVRLRTEALIETQFVVSGSRTEESVLQSPAAIGKINETNVSQLPSLNFYQSIGELGDAQLLSNSLTFQSLNTRGFASTSNTRFVQSIDGADNAPPGLNFALGNFVGVSELDIAEIELRSGASSALYGPNAFNGVVFLSTKNPFDYTGLSAYAKNGVTVQDAAGVNPFVEAGIRYAAVLNDNLAFKINISAFQGKDWFATDYADVDQNPLNPDKGSLTTNPSYDGVNVYGDEIASTFDLDALTGRPVGTLGSIHVARTGYREEDLTNYSAENIKADAAIHYSITDDIELIGSYRFGTGQTMFQGANRYVFDNLEMHQAKIEARSTNFFLRGYTTFENSADSYDARFAAWNVNRFWKSDAQWFQEYLGAYLGNVTGIDSFDHLAARAFADRDRLEPGSDAFDTALDSITSLADLTQGAKFLDRSRLFHVEGQYDFKDFIQFMEVQIGGNYRNYQLISDGTLFSDANGSISIPEYGVYLQGNIKLLNERLKIGGAVRYDKNQNFDGQFNPSAYIVYSAGRNKEHNIRATYQNGFRNPSVQEQFIALNVGVATLLGGATDNVNSFSRTYNYVDALGQPTSANVTGNDVYTNSYTASSVLQFVQTADPSVLQQSTVDFVRPEKVQTFELGYRGVFNKRFYLDIGAYYNQYRDFLGTINAIHPLVGNVADGSAIADLIGGRTTVFQLYTNASETVQSQGVNAGFEYALSQGFRLSGNVNYAALDIGDADADLIPGFNTPEIRFNLGFSNNNVYKGFGFAFKYNWSDAYTWKSTFGTGEVEQFDVVSAQISYKIPSSKVLLRIGGNNILGGEYQTAFGTAAVGSTYFISLLFDELAEF